MKRSDFFALENDRIVEPHNRKLNKCDFFLKFHDFCWTPLQLLAPGTKQSSYATASGL
jgi:hypothetical protein